MGLNNLNKKTLIELYALISLTVLTFTLSVRIDSSITLGRMMVGVVLAFCIWAYTIKKTDLLTELFCNKKKTIVSIIMSAVWLRENALFFINNSVLKLYVSFDSKRAKLLIVGLFILSFFGAFILMHKMLSVILSYLRAFIEKSDIVERRFFIVWIVICVVGVSLVYMSTNAFYNPGSYNALYTFDSEGLYCGNSFMIVGGKENDIRQSLFGFFSLPVSLPAAFISLLFPFKYSYALFVQMFQAIVMGITFVLVARMMGVNGKRKVCVLCFLSSMCSTVLFLFVMEQYIILVFYLIVSVYCITNKVGDRELCAVAAVGTAPTNSLALLWEYKNRASFKDFFLYGLRSFAKWVAFLICLGQTGFLLTIYDNIKALTNYSGESVSITGRVQQFLFFIRSCFLWPASSFLSSDGGAEGPFLRMDPVNQYSIVGIILLIIIVCGWLLSRNNLFYNACFTWVLFSFVLLVAIGYCSVTNDMLLFAHYFGWAYAALLISVCNKVIKNNNAFSVLIISASLVLMIYNLYRLNNIMMVLTKYYPV